MYLANVRNRDVATVRRNLARPPRREFFGLYIPGEGADMLLIPTHSHEAIAPLLPNDAKAALFGNPAPRGLFYMNSYMILPFSPFLQNATAGIFFGSLKISKSSK